MVTSAAPRNAVERRDPGRRLSVDWQMCDGHGLCAEMLPELIHLDEWGFPVVERPVPKHLVREARAAVAACPKLALTLHRPSPD